MTTKRTRKSKRFWEHEYAVTKVDPASDRTEVAIVVGSLDATAKQEEFEDAGFFAVVFNNTTKEEEYRTPGCELRARTESDETQA
jgi:hypothetical protein